MHDAPTIEGLDLATAERMVQARQRVPFKSREDVQRLAPSLPPDSFVKIEVNSSFFEVRGRLRLNDVVLEQRSLVRFLEVRQDGVVATRFGLEESTPLVYLERLRLAGQEDVVVSP